LKRRIISIFILVGSLFLSGVLFITAFRQLPIENTSLGLDWRTIWEGIQHGRVTFGNTENGIGGMFTPPWGVLFLLPFGFLSFRDSWGIISLVTLISLVMSVPRLSNKKLDVMGTVLLILSFPALRNLADGNLEGLVVGGIILMLLGYNSSNPLVLSLGVLLATVKFQETWLLCLVAFYLIWRRWPTFHQGLVFTIIGVTVIFSVLLWGRDWVKAFVLNTPNMGGLSSAMGRGTLIDITASAALGRLGLPLWFISVTWIFLLGITLWLLRHHPPALSISWEYAAFLVAASMLLAPYVSGNSFLTIVAIGIIPLLRRNRFAAIALIILAYLPYLMSKNTLYYYQSYYWSFLLFVVWVVVGHQIATNQHRACSPRNRGPKSGMM